MIPTVFEYLKAKRGISVTDDVIEDFVEFTKMHVEQALKEANDRAELHDRYYDFEDTITNAYPLTNIK